MFDTVVETVDEIVYPSELGAEGIARFGPERRGTIEPKPIGFQCFACGLRHTDLMDVIACHDWLQKFWARGLVKEPVAVEELVAA